MLNDLSIPRGCLFMVDNVRGGISKCVGKTKENKGGANFKGGIILNKNDFSPKNKFPPCLMKVHISYSKFIGEPEYRHYKTSTLICLKLFTFY